MIRYAVKTPPDSAIIIPALQDVKDNLRIESDITEHDDYITELIHSAREYCELYLGWYLAECSIYAYLDEWPEDDIIEISRGPIQSITALEYKAAGATTYSTMSSSLYELSNNQRDARILLLDTPSINDDRLDPIRIEYLAGFHDSDDIPKPVIDAIKLIVTERYLNPRNSQEAVRYLAADRLMRPFKHSSF